MKLVTLILFLSLLTSPGACVDIAWDASPDADVAGYNVYYGTESRHYTTQFYAGEVLTERLCGLDSGSTYYCAVTAVDTNGIESDFSNEIQITAPIQTNIVTVSVPVLSATNLDGPWVNEAVFTISYTNPPGAKFFRFGLAITQTNNQ